MPRDRESCMAVWQQAQRSPSIIGFNVSGDLASSVTISIDGKTLSAVDVRLWEGPAAAGAEVVFLEMLFLDVPATWEEQRVGDACVASVVAHLKERRVSEFRERLAQRKREKGESELRRRRGGQELDEGGDEREESWRDFLGRREEAEPTVHLHAVANIGGTGRRVLACKTSMAPWAAWELGCLAYPRLFEEKTEEETQVEDRYFLACYYSCLALMAVIFVIWILSFFHGLRKIPTLKVSGSG